MTFMDYPLFSGLVVLHSTCFELQGERVEYSKRLHSMPEAACTVKKWTPDDELPEARNM